MEVDTPTRPSLHLLVVTKTSAIEVAGTPRDAVNTTAAEEIEFRNLCCAAVDDEQL